MISSPLSASMSAKQLEQDCLDEHNRLRKRHGCPPLRLSRNLCNIASEWAQHIASRNILQHRTNNRYGENLYMSGGLGVDGRSAVRCWYNEVSKYNYGRPVFATNTGHFTQVVWKASKELGVGFARNGNNVYVVANYDPPGNYANQFTANVPRRVDS